MNEDPTKSLNIPISKLVPKPTAAARTSIDIELGKVVAECFAAIKDYHLHRLVRKSQKRRFSEIGSC